MAAVVVPLSTYACRICKETKPISTLVAGNWCRDCRNAYFRKWNKENPGYMAMQVKRYAQERRKAEIIAKYGSVEEYKRLKKRTFAERYLEDPAIRDRQKAKSKAWLESHPEYKELKKSRKLQANRGIGDLVYFIQATNGGPIKIGYTSKNAERRLKDINSGSWQEYRLLGVIPGFTKDSEADLHYTFIKYNVRGEWFEPVQDILDYIAQNAIPWEVAKNGIKQA